MEEIIRGFAKTKDGKEFLKWIFETSNIGDFSISGDIQKDYYLLGRQSLANDIIEELKKYALDDYLTIIKEMNE